MRRGPAKYLSATPEGLKPWDRSRETGFKVGEPGRGEFGAKLVVHERGRLACHPVRVKYRRRFRLGHGDGRPKGFGMSQALKVEHPDGASVPVPDFGYLTQCRPQDIAVGQVMQAPDTGHGIPLLIRDLVGQRR